MVVDRLIVDADYSASSWRDADVGFGSRHPPAFSCGVGVVAQRERARANYLTNEEIPLRPEK